MEVLNRVERLNISSTIHEAVTVGKRRLGVSQVTQSQTSDLTYLRDFLPKTVSRGLSTNYIRSGRGEGVPQKQTRVMIRCVSVTVTRAEGSTNQKLMWTSHVNGP